MEKINEFLRPRIPNDLLGEYGSITLEKINHPPITLLFIPELDTDNFNLALDEFFEIASGMRNTLLIDMDNSSLQ